MMKNNKGKESADSMKKKETHWESSREKNPIFVVMSV